MNNMRFFTNPIETTKLNFKEYVANNMTYEDGKIHSNTHDALWKNIKKETSAPSVEINRIVMPKMPKYNELSNIIAAGYINSDFDEQDSIPHVAVGGVRQVVDNVEVYDDSKQKEIVYKKAVPYLRVLYVDKNKEQYKYCLKNIQTNE